MECSLKSTPSFSYPVNRKAAAKRSSLVRAAPATLSIVKPRPREAALRGDTDTIVIGVVAYCDSVTSIWAGMMRHFARRGLDVDYVTFSSYERQVHALMAGFIDVAWNGPLAHARTLRLCGSDGVVALGMRDADRDFVTHIITHDGSDIHRLSDLNHRRIAAGTVDSPQAYVMPMHFLHTSGVDLGTLSVTRFDHDIGKHGDTAVGEEGVLDALRAGAADAGFISDLMWQRFRQVPGKTDGLHVLPVTVPPFDHCQFTASRALGRRRAAGLQGALLSMRGDGTGHEEDAATMKLEGIRSMWLPHREGVLPGVLPMTNGTGGGTDGTSHSGSSSSSSSSSDVLDSCVLSRPHLGYEGMLAACEAFGDPVSLWPGLMHTAQAHPFKELRVRS